MKKTIIFILSMMLGMSVMAQKSIQLRSVDKAECVKSDMTSLQASFSFSSIEAQDYPSERGTFSWLSLANTIIGGNEGDPQIPVVNELIAVPFGAQPTIRVTNYSTTDYRLDDYDIHTLVPRQPSLRKDKRPEDVPFVYNEAAYQSTRGFRSEPMAVVEVVGTMRGVQLGKMTIEPVSYDPVNNTLRVFNDIEVTVYFDDADARATEEMLVKTYSPYFDIVYKSLFNGRAVTSVYDDHPDLYTTPVKMLVVTTSTYANSTPFQNWLTWKKQKGIDVDVLTVADNASSSTIKNLIYSRYNANHPSFLVIVGDESVVKYYSLWDYDSYYGDAATDLEYASVDGDIYHDMFLSRMPVSSTTQLGYLVNKILMYEKYTMPDPSYLDETLLIAGWDQPDYSWQTSWTNIAGKPTIQYANNNYFNAAHGITPHVFITTGTNQRTCYNYINQVGFVNYTAHGNIQEWSDPSFTNSNVNSLTNTNKPFWAMGNCCLSASFSNTSTYPCFGEAMIRANNKGAFGYIGSVVETYWYEDLYFGVGAFNAQYSTNNNPTVSGTSKGVYDALFDETSFNSLNAVPYIGNISVSYAYAQNYENSEITPEYYWRCYQCFGDGSVMPYLKQPAANNVSHAPTIRIGIPTFTVSADAGSYVAITKNNEILGVAQVDATGSVNVPISGLTSTGDVMIVVTRNQRQPYIDTIQAVFLNGPFISLDSYTPNTALVGENTNLNLTFKNVGNQATSGTTTVTLTSMDSNVTIFNSPQTFNALAPNATTTVSGFQFCINSGLADGTEVILHYNATNGNNSWEGDLTVSVIAAVLEYKGMTWDGSYTPGETITVNAKFKNTGHYEATNAMATIASTSNYVSFAGSTVSVGTIAVDEQITVSFTITIAANCPQSTLIPITFTLTADGGLNAQGSETLKNTCNVIFVLTDEFNDGWDGNATLRVSFDDGSPAQNLTVASGQSPKTIPMEIGNGVHVTLTWIKGTYDEECSITVSYEEGSILIYEMAQNSNPSAGVLYEFDCNCAAATAIFNVNVSPNYSSYGTVSGGGEFSYGQLCTLTATPAEGFYFTHWTENGEVVSSANPYAFRVYDDHNLVANFVKPVEIGTNTTTSVYLPSYSYYKQALTQQIYTATEIGMTGTITYIAFYNGGTKRTRDYDFYLKHTNKSTFNSNTDWITVQASDKVFSGTVTMTANAWTFITFDTPFEYDGTSNLVLVADDNTGDYDDSPYMACSVYNTNGYQTHYVYSDGTNYNPMSPPTSYSNNQYHARLTKKNHILLGIEPTFTKNIPAYTPTGGWVLIASPLTEAVTPSPENGFLTNDYDLYYFDQASDSLEWINYKGDNGNFNLVSGKGYLYANSQNDTLVFTGYPYNGNGQVTLSKTSGTHFEGWNLVGNPFAQTAYITMPFYTMNLEGSEVIASTSNSVGAMEGIFVVANEDGETMTFSTEEPNRGAALVMNICQNRGSVIDRAIICFGEGNNLPKFMLNKNNTTLYIPQDNKDYAVVNANNVGEMPVNFKAAENGTYTLSFSMENVAFNYLHLIDTMTGADIDLLALRQAQGPASYTFEAKTTDQASRFRLVFSANETE